MSEHRIPPILKLHGELQDEALIRFADTHPDADHVRGDFIQISGGARRIGTSRIAELLYSQVGDDDAPGPFQDGTNEIDDRTDAEPAPRSGRWMNFPEDAGGRADADPRVGCRAFAVISVLMPPPRRARDIGEWIDHVALEHEEGAHPRRVLWSILIRSVIPVLIRAHVARVRRVRRTG